MAGDPLGSTTFPYAGLRGKGRHCIGKDCCGRPLSVLDYQWRLIGSPVAWNNWHSAFDIHCAGPVAIDTSRTLYTMDSNRGFFLEAEAEAFVPLTPSLSAFMWGLGSWLNLRGHGTIDATIVPGNFSAAADPFTDIFGGRPGSGSSNSVTFNRSYYIAGLGLRLTI